ncbi:MAG TPA: hypothetical protein VK179_01015 [Bacteroidales bacterium]|nr:hypothetical protein [Bacteroidales bacterium]
MKKAIIPGLVLLLLLFVTGSSGQEFQSPLDFDHIEALFNSSCVVKLNSGEDVTGTFNGIMMSSENYLSQIIIRLENKKWKKYHADEISSFWVKSTSRAGSYGMLHGRTISVNGWTMDLDGKVIGDYFIFYPALKNRRGTKIRLYQLLNPGFDNRIKVLFYEYCEGGSRGTGIGADFTYTDAGSMTFILVKDGESYFTKPQNYQEIGKQLYSDCPKMREVFGGTYNWNDLIKHIIVYDKFCRFEY